MSVQFAHAPTIAEEARPNLRVRVQINTGDYGKSEECQVDFLRNMTALLAYINEHRFVPLIMEDDFAATLVNTHYIVAIEEIGARGGGL